LGEDHGLLCGVSGASRSFGRLRTIAALRFHNPELSYEQPSLKSDYTYEEESEQRYKTSTNYQKAVVRRFLIALILFPGGGLSLLLGLYNSHINGSIRGVRLIWGGAAACISGLGLYLCNFIPATWDWPI
jgi:hypothetical protein